MRSKLYPLLTLSIFILITACKEDDETVSPADVITIEGIEYSTVTIGTQTWTASNHAGAGGIRYDEVNSKPEYGKYYTYDEVKAFTLPEGWRIPAMEDYKTLAAAQGIVVPSHGTHTEGIKTITSTTNWKNTPGTNTTGFNALPAGYSFNNSSPMDGDIAEFWTAEGNTMSIQEGANPNSLRILFYGGSSDAIYRFNVRFVKDNL